MSSSYIIISYHISCSVILSLLLIWSPFYSILLYFKLIEFDSILFYFIEFDLLYCSVLYLISMNDLCLSVRPSVRLSVCFFISMNKFMFSLLVHFSLPFFSFLMNIFLTHSHTRTRTHKYMHMNICSFL